MKKTIILILLVNKLLASNDLNSTAFDMFLFKIGFTSMAGELENQKEISAKNRDLINQLKERLDSFSDVNKNNTISNAFSPSNTKDEKIVKLEDKILLLENKLNEVLKNKSENKVSKINKKVLFNNKSKYKLAVLITNKSNIYSQKDYDSKVLFEVTRNNILKIKQCDEFLWCELYEKKGFIAQYKLKF